MLFIQNEYVSGSPFFKYIGPKIRSDIPENLKSFRLIHFENNIEKSGCLARIPVDFCFICLSLSVIQC